jgi:hypothetical protein
MHLTKPADPDEVLRVLASRGTIGRSFAASSESKGG